MVGEASKNFCCNLSAEERVEFNYVARGSVSDAAFFDALLSCETAEIVCPCALRYQVTQESLKTMLNKTWSGVPTKDRFVVPEPITPMECTPKKD